MRDPGDVDAGAPGRGNPLASARREQSRRGHERVERHRRSPDSGGRGRRRASCTVPHPPGVIGEPGAGLFFLTFPVFVFSAVLGLWKAGRLRASDDLD